MLRVILALVLAPSALSAAPVLPDVDAEVAQVVGNETPGLAVLVTRNGEVIHMAGYGLADIESETPVTPRSIFDLASVSKEMTALMAAMQIEEETYTPATPVAEILPDLGDGETDRPLTVGDLVHHIGGLPDYLNGSLDYDETTTNDDVIAWLANEPREAEPGEVFSYSNSGYVTLGSVVVASDEANSLADVLTARLWGPLVMEMTSLTGPVDPDLAVTGYDGTDGNFESSHEPTVIEGDGNVFTNLEDLAKYEAALSRGDLLDNMSVLFANGTMADGSPIDDDGQGYGYGWFLEDIEGSDYAMHSGSWMGTSTYFQRNLTTGVSVILLANGESIDLDALALNVEAAAD